MFNGINGLEILKNWPRYESGEPVGFGDGVSRNGEDFEVKAIALYCDGSFSLNFWAYSKGERVKRPAPAVPAADGKPLEAGQTVWEVATGERYTVVEIYHGTTEPDFPLHCVKCERDGDVASHMFEPSQLTHTKPEPPDSWERIEEDAGCTAAKYNERRGTIFTTKQQVARDLVRRCRALAERGE